MPRRAFLAASLTALSAPALTSCADLVAPRPDGTIEVLHALANRDVKNLEEVQGQGSAATAVAEIRAAQAEALAAEITRACGTLKDGRAPEKCGEAVALPAAQPAPDDLVAMIDSSRSSRAILDSLASRGTLREDYDARLATAVDGGLVLAARLAGAKWEDLVPQPPTGESLLRDAESQLTDALQAEYALIYGLGVVAPHVTGDDATAVEARGVRHRLLRDAAIALFAQEELQAPSAAAGYSATKEAPAPDDAPIDYLIALERHCAQAWEDVVKAAKEAPTRLFALNAAGISAAGASSLAGDATQALPGLK